MPLSSFFLLIYKCSWLIVNASEICKNLRKLRKQKSFRKTIFDTKLVLKACIKYALLSRILEDDYFEVF
jgi:hypothetical protein